MSAAVSVLMPWGAHDRASAVGARRRRRRRWWHLPASARPGRRRRGTARRHRRAQGRERLVVRFFGDDDERVPGRQGDGQGLVLRGSSANGWRRAASGSAAPTTAGRGSTRRTCGSLRRPAVGLRIGPPGRGRAGATRSSGTTSARSSRSSSPTDPALRLPDQPMRRHHYLYGRTRWLDRPAGPRRLRRIHRRIAADQARDLGLLDPNGPGLVDPPRPVPDALRRRQGRHAAVPRPPRRHPARQDHR